MCTGVDVNGGCVERAALCCYAILHGGTLVSYDADGVFFAVVSNGYVLGCSCHGSRSHVDRIGSLGSCVCVVAIGLFRHCGGDGRGTCINDGHQSVGIDGSHCLVGGREVHGAVAYDA